MGTRLENWTNLSFRKKAARVFGLAGLAALALCLISLARDSTKDGSRSDAAARACETGSERALASSDQDIRAADDAGKLRIIDIQPRRIRLAGKVCVVVAGVAPSTEAERFEAAIVTKRAFADNAQALLTRAVAEAHAANEQAALKRYEADTAKLTGQSNATQLDTVASAEKPKVQLSETQKANRQKELLDAKKDLAAAIEERTASRRRLKSRCS